MTFDKLMEDATNIQSTAIRLAVQRGEAHEDYARHTVEGYYDDIPGLFKPFSQMPGPEAYKPMILDLRGVLEKLSSGHQSKDPVDKDGTYYANPELARMTSASDYLADWSGSAAIAFKRNFLDPFSPISRNQFLLTAIARGALMAHSEMWEKARGDIDKIAHLTLDALTNNGCCSPNKWTMTFTVVASVAAIAAVPLSPVALTAATVVTAVGAASQVISTQPPPEVKVDYQGEDVHQVMDNMKSAMRKLAEEIQSAERKIYEALRTTANLAGTRPELFISARPALADAHAGNITSYMGSSG